MTPQVQQHTTTKPRLPALDGFRFIVAFWLVFAHNYNAQLDEEGTVYQRFCMRRYVAVTFFFVLSGYCSQYAYGSRDFGNQKTTRNYFKSRFGSILACYYASTVVALVIRALGQHYTSWRQWLIGVPLVTTLLQCWITPFAYFGNTPGWTLSTMAAHWLAFPFLQIQLLKIRDSHIKWYCMATPLIAVLPISITLLFKNGSLDTSQQWLFFYTFPPLRLAEFVLGALLAELFVRGIRPKLAARLADGVFPVVFLLILAVPYSSRLTAYDCLLVYATMPLFGLLVFGSSCDVDMCYTARFFALPACRRLGDFAFQVYLWRWPLFAIAMRLQDGYWKRGYLYLRPFYFVPAFFVLYGFSYLWYKRVDTPLRQYLQNKTAPPASLESQVDVVVPDNNKSHTVEKPQDNSDVHENPQQYTRMV